MQTGRSESVGGGPERTAVRASFAAGGRRRAAGCARESAGLPQGQHLPPAPRTLAVLAELLGLPAGSSPDVILAAVAQELLDADESSSAGAEACQAVGALRRTLGLPEGAPADVLVCFVAALQDAAALQPAGLACARAVADGRIAIARLASWLERAEWEPEAVELALAQLPPGVHNQED